MSLIRLSDCQDVTYDNVAAHLHAQADAYFRVLNAAQPPDTILS